MAKSGTKISRLGKDVRACSDYDLTFISEAPTLAIAASGSFDITNASTMQTLYQHNLGYAPLYVVFIYSGANLMIESPGSSQFLRCDSSSLKWYANEYGYPVSLKGHYVIFRRALADSFESKSSKAAFDVQGNTATIKGYGIKVIDDGHPIKSESLDDYVINSEYKNFIIHKQESKVLAAGEEMTVTHNLSYPPLYMAWGDLGYGGYQAIFNADDASTIATSSDVKLRTFYAGTYSIVIFKDPMQ